jgi:hypothetical protein
MARLSALFAAVLSLAVAPVQAVSSSSASLSDVAITLFDLNPADGITSGITFAGPGGSAFVSAQSEGDSQSSEATGAGPFDLSVSTTLSSARATLTGTGPANVTSLTASGSAQGPLAPGSDSRFEAYVSAPSFSSFTVTANTLVSFSALANLEATTTGGVGQEFVNAGAQMVAQGPGPGGGGFQDSRDRLVASEFGPFNGSIKKAGLLNVSFANLTGSAMVGEVHREVLVGGFSAAVPEPETYAPMLAGLGLVAFMIRRRRGPVRLPGV